MMYRYHTSWPAHATYLTENTPLSRRQAEIVALKKTGHSTEEIRETLILFPGTVEDYWSDVLEQWERAQELCTVMGPHPWGEDETRSALQFDDTAWNKLSAGGLSHADEERTRVELELFHGESYPMSDKYLLIEREIVDTAEYATRTTEERSAHEVTALRSYLYSNADTLEEYYLRYALLHHAGIDPMADGARTAESVLDRKISETDADAARDHAIERVDPYSMKDYPPKPSDEARRS